MACKKEFAVLDSFKEQGFPFIIDTVFVEPNTPKPGDTKYIKRWLVNRSKLGIFWNFMQLLNYAEIQNFRYLLYLEDDVVLFKNCWETLRDLIACLGSSFGVISLYTPDIGLTLDSGWNDYNPDRLMNGAQGLLMTRRFVKKYIPYARQVMNLNPSRFNIDRSIFCFARCSNESTLLHVPSLCEHLNCRKTTATGIHKALRG